MMLVEVFKENNSFPVGTQFVYDKARNMFISAEKVEDISDNYYSVMTRRFSFSPSFYEINKDIFNQVKLEEHEENKMAESAQSAQAESSESENVSNSNQPSRVVDYGAEVREKDQREEVEEGTSEGPPKGRRLAKRGSASSGKSEEDTKHTEESRRTDKLNEIDARLQELARSILEVKTVIDKFKE